MEQLLGEFENLNLASNAKLDSIEEQYRQDDTGIVDTGATSGSHRRKIKTYLYITRQTRSKSHGKINTAT